MNLIVYTEKRNGFAQDSIDLKSQCHNLLQIDCDVRVLNGYTVNDISSNDIDKAIKYVFSEPMVDNVFDTLPKVNGTIIAREPLPGQYDQRSDSAVQCLKCLNFESNPSVKSFQVVLFNRVLSKDEENRFIKFWINPVEMRVKELDKEINLIDIQKEPKINDFCEWTDFDLQAFLKKESAAMTMDDLKLIQDYFKIHEKRDLSYTEFKVLDTYWSDHCRHTTFETEITDIEIEESPYSYVIKETLNQFYEMRKQLNREHKAITLMELATMFGRYRKDPRVEISDEINACSVVIDVNTDQGKEEWLLMFKNETHNHPTEIEPFGGASTCIGGAIRDPLSGRSYVYQAMRISGCGNVKESFDSTLENKLPQRIIASKATQGNASYGNQIGVCTSYVKEIYHPSYVAKHLECGAVVGAVKKEYVKRLKPEVNDCIILLGGRTGRDGIGGATGSSKIHSNSSLKQSGSEVQKGNAPEERKLQRLFRNPNVTKLIKKSNDFGAGGVCVAIGELADGCEIWLDKVPLKYEGLNPTEIAISESQERMAVVVDPKDCELFMEYAKSENIEASIVARITDNNRLCMKYYDQVVVNLDRNLINTNGVRQKVKSILVQKPILKNKSIEFNELSLLQHLNSLNVTSQKGLIEQFDGSIGATTVLYPLGGKYQLTPSIASVQKIAMEKGNTSTVSILSYGFNPSLSEINPFLSAQASVLESIAKTICVGGQIENIYFSFQEYFAKLYQDPKKWGNVVQTLLGAQSVQSCFNRPAIGGKDSMSGSFNEKDVLDTFISFACSYSEVDKVLSNETKSVGNKIYLVYAKRSDNGLFDLESIKSNYYKVEKLIQNKKIISANVVKNSLVSTLCEMSFGNNLGLNIQTNHNLMEDMCGSILLEVSPDTNLNEFDYLGDVTQQGFMFNGISIEYDHAKTAYISGLEFLYPIKGHNQSLSIDTITTSIGHIPYAHPSVNEVHVVIPVFPGTNCEVDTARAFEKAGAQPHISLIRNLDANALKESIHDFCHRLDHSHILALPGGFSGGDEPDGSAKFIVNILNNEDVKNAVKRLLARDGLIIGICNGFQALIKTGYLPYGEIRELNETDATLAHNTIHRHISTMARVRQSTDGSPWLKDGLGQVSQVPLSHGEGRLVMSHDLYQSCVEKGQIAFQYVNEDGIASMDPLVNVNGSSYAIEGLISPCGRILGKMGHTERIVDGCYKNIPDMVEMKLFENGVNYFRRGSK